MLEGLDLVDWATLHHAHGHADDVPGRLQLLASPDDRVRASALAALGDTLWERGRIFEATAFAVPFLYELLGESTLPDRPGIAVLLGRMARARAAPVSDPEAAERENDWVLRARQALVTGLGCPIRLLGDADRPLRLAAAHLLSCFPDEAWRTLLPLRQAYVAETSPDHRAALALALALLGEVHSEAFAVTSPAGRPLAAFAALAQRVTNGRSAVDNALDVLLDASRG